MKVTVVLIVAMVMLMGQETDSWFIRKRSIKEFFVRREPRIRVRYGYGKREGVDADFQAKYKDAAEDGVFTDEEIKSVFGVDNNGLADFRTIYDMDGDGVVQVDEYEEVEVLSASMQE